MNGAHDLGGMDGFGPVDRSQTEHFPDEWQRQVFALTLACGLQGKWNLDQSRFARERTDPGEYLNSSYYEHWLHGLETLLVEQGLVTQQELDSGTAAGRSFEPVERSAVAAILQKGGPVSMPADSDPRYHPGQAVRLINLHPSGHTRLPRYVRGRSGHIVHHHGAHIYPDRHASDGVKKPAHLYTIAFDAAEIWGKDETAVSDRIMVDVFEPYIECAL